MLSTIEIHTLKEIFSSPKKITIISHRNPDGDAMGSSLGLYAVLKQQNHAVNVMMPNEFPDFLSWLPNANLVHIYERDASNCQKILTESDLLILLDFNALHRTGDAMEHFLKTIQKTTLLIDHHQEPDAFPNFLFSDTSYGSTCEMMYNFINALDFNSLLNKEVATCLYTGIVTDSGSFRFPKTTSKTHQCVAHLIDLGINNSAIHESLFDTASHSRLLLLGKALQNLVVLPQYNTSYIHLSQDELNQFEHQKGDTEGIVNYGLTLKNIDFTAIFIENKEEGIIKISFRSQGKFDVNTFARNHFNGGGHVNAAGGKSYDNLETTIKKFIAILATSKNKYYAEI